MTQVGMFMNKVTYSSFIQVTMCRVFHCPLSDKWMFLQELATGNIMQNCVFFCLFMVALVQITMTNLKYNNKFEMVDLIEEHVGFNLLEELDVICCSTNNQ